MESSLESPNKTNVDEENHVSYKLVPWINWQEWNFVRESLFSSSPDSIDAALTRISTWRIRGCLPILIDVTATIIQIQQKDPEFRKDLNDDALNSEAMLGMLYSMAIMRLVNGVTENKERGDSIANEAERIGLPRKLVDIRHEASHQDLPSLQLVRLASVEALEWIKSNYWGPQKNAISFQMDKFDFVRKKVRSKLHELACYLNMEQGSQSGSLSMKRKRSKQSNAIFGHYNLFSHKAKLLQGSQSRGPKTQITKILQILFRLYTSFPSEVVAVLQDFLLKALVSTGMNGLEPSDNSGMEPISGDLETQTSLTDLCKLVITRLSKKEPELILVMLKAVLETMKAEAGIASFSGLPSKAERRKTKQLSSLVLWLMEKYNKLNNPSQIGHGDAINASSERNAVSKVALAELLKTCLIVSSPGNDKLARSALRLAQMMGNSSMVERLKKLPSMRSTNVNPAEESSVHTDISDSIIQQESSISRAAKMLKFLKRHRNKDIPAGIMARNSKIPKNEGRWTVAKSWNLCPIGMLPCSLGSTGVLPILDRASNQPKVQDASERRETWEHNCYGGKAQDSHDDEILEKTDAIEGTMIKEGQDDDRILLLEPFKDQLMVGGVYKKVCPEELLAIEAAVRVLV